ncbi:PIN domain-containing protein [Streptomyces sp. NPDC086783]|uniref:PIN domain-containing protein n=1 Tax=Streptomyces sp. NPDC086783 TaxID=3365758 RepID=UPI0037F48CD2
MIILDSSILFRTTLRHANADLIRTIRAAGVEKVAVPWTVMEELAAQRAVAYRDKHAAAREALDALQDTTPWRLGQNLPALDLERVREHWRKEFAEFVDVLPVSESVLRESLFREANALAPCKRVSVKGQDKPEKVGGRDVSIWLTAVEYARDHKDETVYFVSRNTTDFGDGSPGSYQYPMDGDVRDLGDRFVHYTSLDDVVKKFTEETEADEAGLRAVLDESQTLIAHEAYEAQRFLAATGDPMKSNLMWCTVHPGVELSGEPVGDGGRTVSLGWLMQPETKLECVKDVSAYRIGDHVWCTATTRWLLSGTAVLAKMRMSPAVAAWEVRVLLNLSHPSSPLYILRTAQPQAVSQEEASMLAVPGWGKSWSDPSAAMQFERGSLAETFSKLTLVLAASLHSRGQGTLEQPTE